MSDPSPTEPSAEDTDRFMQLIMKHRHGLYAFIAKQLINPADTEDVFQKTSIVLWKKMKNFDANGSFFSWACGIAFNEVRNFLRIRRRRRVHFDVELTQLLAEEAKEEERLSQSRLEALRHCMQKLSARQQEILQRCYMESASITQVAKILGRERTALYKQLARLKQKLADCIRLRTSSEGGV